MAAMTAFLYFISTLMVLPAMTSSEVISLSIQNGQDLNQFKSFFGCGSETSAMSSNTVVEIEGGRRHTLMDKPHYCLLSGVSNVTIRSSTSETAWLQCPSSSQQQRTGFGFYNVSNLTIKNIAFDNCGNVMPVLVKEESPGVSWFGANQQAVIAVSMSTDVSLTNVSITNYYGIAILALTVMGNLEINGLNILNSYAYNELRGLIYSDRDDWLHSGSGLVVRFTDTNITYYHGNTKVSVANVIVMNNRNLFPKIILFDLEELVILSEQTEYTQISYGGNGVFIVSLSNNEYNVELKVKNATIRNNFGTIGGGITLAHVDSNLRSKVTLDECDISDNSNGFMSGSGIQIYYVFTNRYLLEADYNNIQSPDVHHTFMWNSIIRNNTAPKNGGGVAVYIGAQNFADIALSFTNTTFLLNRALINGDCLLFQREYSSFFKSQQINVYLNNVKVHDNGYRRSVRNPVNGCIYAAGLSKLIVSGSEENMAEFSGQKTSVIRAINSHVYLNGSVRFIDNHGLRGGALYLSDNSNLFFVHGAKVDFYNNSADEYGGAVAAESINGLQCEIQFLPSEFTPKELNYTIFDVADAGSLHYDIVFENNWAVTGNSIFGTQIYNCTAYPEAIVQIPSTDIGNVYEALFTFTGSNSVKEIRSRPYRVCHCSLERNTCLDPEYAGRNYTFPGVEYTINVMVADVVGQAILAPLYATLVNTNNNAVTLADFQNSLLLPGACSQVNYTFLTRYSNVSVMIYLHTYSYGDNTTLAEKVLIRECPIGFAIDRVSSICTCTLLYQTDNRGCDINTGLIQRKHNEWIGIHLYQDRYVPAFYRDCPIGYCNSDSSIDLSQPSSICSDNREGAVCGRCREGYSNVFGSQACAKCSNLSLLTVMVYMLLGILLVVVIYVLDLTVTCGTINGIVFYAQMTSITNNIFAIERGTDYISRLVRFINLEIGIPINICFYNNMTALSEYTIQFLFPIYLISIILCILLLTKCSSIEKKINLSRSVNIFVTLIYLSSGKVLTTLILLLSPLVMQIEVDGIIIKRLVWYYDGSQEFFQGTHLIIGIIAALVLVFIVFPYQFIIMFSKWWIRFQSLVYYLPIVDANVAPFKDKYRFWFGMRLIITSLIIMIAVSLSPHYPLLVYLINIAVLSCLVVIQSYVKPYKSKAVNILDLSFLLNLLLLYACQLYVYGTDNENKLLGNVVPTSELYLGYERVSAAVALITFVGILVYHIVRAVKQSNCYKKCKMNKSIQTDKTSRAALSLSGAQFRLRPLQTTSFSMRQLQLPGSSYSRYRESALEL